MRTLKLAAALMRGQASRAWLFIFCLAVGVAARVSIGSFLESLDRGLGREARNLLTADLELSSRKPLDPGRLAELKALAGPGAAHSRRLSLLTMASAQGTEGPRSRLVQLAAVDASYPLVGELKAEGPQGEALDAGHLQGRAWAYAQPELLAQLGLQPGDSLRLGGRAFRLAGVLRQEPGLGGGVFSLGPRVLIALDQAPATGLTGPGSRLSHEDLLTLAQPQRAEALAAELRRRWGLDAERGFMGSAPEDGLRLRTTRSAQGEVRLFFERLTEFLSLVSLMALLLGGVGVASVTRGFVRAAAQDIGILRGLGASPGRIRAVFAWQAALLGLAGGGLGALAGLLAQSLLPQALQAFLPVQLEAVLSLRAAAWGLGLGLVTALVFGVEPVLAAGGQSAADLLRDEDPPLGAPWTAWAWRALGALLFTGLAVLEADDLKRGAGSLLGLGLGALLLQALGAWTLPRLARLRAAGLPFALRHALANLGRPGLRAGATLVALGSTALLLGLLAVYQHSLLAELDPGRRGSELPQFFLIDVQRDQVEDLRAFLQAKPGVQVELSPMVRARYRGKLGEEGPLWRGEPRTDEERRAMRMRTREQNLSWRPGLGRGERLAKGRWMDTDGEELEASLEEDFARRLGADLGDVLRFDVQGVELQAKVTSLRKVHWASFQPNFFILLSPWAIEDAPQTWIGSIMGAGDAGARAALQAELALRHPNVTLFDVAEGTGRILALLDKIQAAVRLVAWACLATGLVVLAGLALASARSRRAEGALLKALGAGPGQLLGAALAEYGLLAGLAAGLGLALSLGLGWVMMVQALELRFAAPWAQVAALGALFTATGGLVGAAASWRVYRVKPAEVLRED